MVASCFQKKPHKPGISLGKLPGWISISSKLVKIYRSLLVIYANAYGALPVTVIYPYEVRAGLAV
jgi:hypothetical protein